jgi:hypothetical protein
MPVQECCFTAEAATAPIWPLKALRSRARSASRWLSQTCLRLRTGIALGTPRAAVCTLKRSSRRLRLEQRNGLGKRRVGRLRVIPRPNVAPEVVLGIVQPPAERDTCLLQPALYDRTALLWSVRIIGAPPNSSALTVRYPTVAIHFAETRPLAEEWTYRFLGAALAYHQAGTP